MRKSLAVLVGMILLIVAPRVVAGESDAAIRQVISDQIAAFRSDDFEAAFTYASPSIQRAFRNPERFGEMVRSGYPMVWRPADVRFTALQEMGGRTIQTLVITDERGALHVLDYDMVETERGWEIDGVRVRRPSDAGA